MSRRELSREAEERFFAGVKEASEFFMGKANVQRAMDKLVRRLEELEIPYAIIGAMALNAYGYERATSDVDVLLTQQGLDKFKAAAMGNGYAEVPGRDGLRDTDYNVRIDVLLSGGRVPDPAVAERGARTRLLPIDRFIELKLASGMSAPHRLRDLADVLELIRVCGLPADFEARLDSSVREKYRELWTAAQGATDEE